MYIYMSICDGSCITFIADIHVLVSETFLRIKSPRHNSCCDFLRRSF